MFELYLCSCNHSVPVFLHLKYVAGSYPISFGLFKKVIYFIISGGMFKKT